MARGSRSLALALVIAAVAATGLAGCGDAGATSSQGFSGQITQNDADLRHAVDGWRSAGDPPTGPAPSDVLDRSAELQDEIARLGDHPNLAARVIPLLSPTLRAGIKRLYGARRSLLRLSAGSKHKKLKLGQRPPLADLAASLGMEKLPFKRDVRKLKELGLTESLPVGYRLSPRGRAYLRGYGSQQ